MLGEACGTDAGRQDRDPVISWCGSLILGSLGVVNPYFIQISAFLSPLEMRMGW